MKHTPFLGEDVGRSQPHSDEAERCLLGSLMMAQPLIADVSAILGGNGNEKFYNENHGVIYRTIVAMDEKPKPVNLVTVTQTLAGLNRLEQVGGAAVLTNLSNATPTAGSWEFYLNIVLSRWRLRQLIEVGTQIVSESFDTQDDGLPNFLDHVEKLVFGLTQTGSVDDRTHGPEQIAAIGAETIDRIIQLKGKPQGLTTPWRQLDFITSGWCRSQVIIFAGDTSSGKTTLAMNCAAHTAVLDAELKAVGVFSQEMPVEQLSTRLICSIAEVNRDRVRRGLTTDEEMKKLVNAAGLVRKSRLVIDEQSGLTVQQLRSKARAMVKRWGVELLIVDFIQLMTSSNEADNAVAEISANIIGIQNLSKELRLPIIVVSQFNRGKKDGNAPKLSDLKGASTLEQAGDVVVLLQLDDEDEDAKSKEIVSVVAHVEKNRNGPCGKVPLILNRPTNRFHAACVEDFDAPEQRVEDALPPSDRD